MGRYYAFGGAGFVQQMIGGLKRTPEAIRAYVGALGEVGVEEIFLWPTVAALEQIDRLAEALL